MKRTIVNPIFKDTVTFLQTSAETNGRITDLEVTLMPKGMFSIVMRMPRNSPPSKGNWD
jgi:hypothetical protein